MHFAPTPQSPNQPRLRFLEDKGIEYLREYLNLPADVVPATLKKSARPAGEGRRPPMGGDRPPRGPPREGGYRYARGHLPLSPLALFGAAAVALRGSSSG